jgi:hypothetical protein
MGGLDECSFALTFNTDLGNLVVEITNLSNMIGVGLPFLTSIYMQSVKLEHVYCSL